MSTLEITTKIGCSNACIYCPQSKLTKAYARRTGDLVMKMNTYKECIDKLPKDVIVEFSGMVEPWLNKDCTEMVLYAHQKGHKINVFTTLAGMTKEDFEKVKHIPFGYFWIHLPSDGKQEFIPVTQKYLELLRIVFNEYKDNTKTKISFHIRGQEPIKEVKEIVREKLQKKKLSTRADNVKVNNVNNPERLEGKLKCRRGIKQNILLPNGDVVLCCMDYGLKHIIGNLLDSSYEDLYKSDEFLKVEKGLKNEDLDILCRHCDMFAEKVNIKNSVKKIIKKIIRY